MTKKPTPSLPGKVLRKYLGETGLSAASRQLGVHRATLSRILAGKAGISPDMAYRLASAFGTTPEFWAEIQMRHDLHQAAKLKRPKIERLQASQAVLAEHAAAGEALSPNAQRFLKSKSILGPISVERAVAVALKLGIFTADGRVGKDYR